MQKMKNLSYFIPRNFFDQTERKQVNQRQTSVDFVFIIKHTDPCKGAFERTHISLNQEWEALGYQGE